MSRIPRRPQPNGNSNGKALATPQAVNAAVKAICDIMRRSNCAGAMQYVPELTWILFLGILDAQEDRNREAAEAVGDELITGYRRHNLAGAELEEL